LPRILAEFCKFGKGSGEGEEEEELEEEKEEEEDRWLVENICFCGHIHNKGSYFLNISYFTTYLIIPS
jgi:hypothetical protein